MDTERRHPEGENQQSHNERSPPHVDEDEEPLSTEAPWLVPDIALSSADTPALDVEIDGFRASNSSDTEGRDVPLEDRDHILGGMDNRDSQIDHTLYPHPGTPIRITPQSTEQIARSGGSIRSFGQPSNPAGSAQQSSIYNNPAALTPDGLSHDATTSGPDSLTSNREDGPPPGARARPRRRFIRWFRDHFNRQAPWSPIRRHDPSRVRQVIREFERMYHRR